MSSRPDPLRSRTQQPQLGALDPESYTALRLHHATPQHLYLTTRRLFIGPIPEGWLKSHRKSWYKHHLHIENYSSRQATFRAGHEVSRKKLVTGLETGRESQSGARPHTRFQPSFPRPEDLEEEDDVEGSEREDNGTQREAHKSQRASLVDGAAESREEEEDGLELEDQPEDPDDEEEATTEAPPAIEVPRSNNPDEDLPQLERSHNAGSHRADAEESQKCPESEQASTPRIEHLQPAPNASTKRSSDATSYQDRRESAVPSSRLSEIPDPCTSTSALLPQEGEQRQENHAPESPAKKILHRVKRSVSRTPDENPDGGDYFQNGQPQPLNDEETGRRHSHVRFLSEDSRILAKARRTQTALRRSSTGLLRRSMTNGQIIKMDKMLVRVDATPERKLPPDYDENGSQSIISRVEEKWREYMVVCRQSTTNPDAEFTLLMYKTRVIPAVDNSEHRKRATYAISLGKKVSEVNLYSSLDKTVVLWTPGKRETKIYILRPRSAASSVEWYTFLRNVLGWHRLSEVEVNVPDLSLQLRIANPFEELEALQEAQDDTDDEEAANRAIDEEQRVANRIIERCLQMLENNPEWKDVVTKWAGAERIGLAWRRYDRLEWIHGSNERKMYGTMGMVKTHDLELRLKVHYPTAATTRKGKHLTEPLPVEGFLIRLTSQKGQHQRFGKLFFKRLYFSTHDHYLCFSRPAKAYPPPPPKIPSTENGRNPTSHQIADKIPILYGVNPYPVEDGEITWLRSGRRKNTEAVTHHNQDAYDEMIRKVQALRDCDGFIDLCDVAKVRNMKKGASPADDNIDEGSDVDYDVEVTDTREDDGTTTTVDESRSFELVLINGLAVRLQAYDKETKKEWKTRLRELVKYWKYRHTQDIDLYKTVRQQNLDTLHIDEEAEAIVGQFAKKWEVTQTYASPQLYNMCGISCCRTIHMSGPLYRKPRRRGLFTSTHCVLIPGRMLIFSSTLRKSSGKSVPSIHHEKIDSVDLSDCYIYSGLLTENDLLYQNRTFDSNNPGHNALPRMWLEDGWTSQDEDVMTCFVIWRPTSKSWFRQPGAEQDRDTEDDQGKKKSGLARVSQLGVKGRTIVFKARSRAERDHWVLAIAAEIERLQSGEDVRLTHAKGVEKKNGKGSGMSTSSSG